MNQIYIYEGCDIMLSILNFIAIENPHHMWGFFIQSIAMIAIIISFFRFLLAKQNNIFTTITRYALIWIIVPTLMHPGDTILVHDQISKETHAVDNVPMIITTIITPLEHFSYIASEAIRNHFKPASVPHESAAQMYFGIRLKNRYNHIKINTPEWKDNISNFMNQCVINSVVLKNFTIQEFLESNNSWAFLETNLNDFFTVEIKTKNNKKILSCREAATELKKIAESRKNNIISKYLKSIFYSNQESDNDIANFLRRYLKTQSGEVGSVTYDNFTNIVLWNELKDISDAYGDSRIRNQNMSANYFSNQNTAIYLPVITTIFKGVVILLIPFMLIIYVLTMNSAVILGLFNFLLALYLAIPVSEVFNIIILVAWHNSVDNIELNYNNFMKFANEVSPYVTIGMSLRLMVLPFCWALVSRIGMAQSMMHLAGNMMQSSIGSTSYVSQEMASGNLSMGNKSIANTQLHNRQGFQVKTSPSMDVIGSNFTEMDNTKSNITGAGKVIYDTTQTVGRGTTSINLQEAREKAYAQNMQDTIQKMKELRESRTHSISRVETKAKRFNDQFVKSVSKSENSALIEQIKNTKAYQQSLTEINQSSLSGSLSAEAKASLALANTISTKSAKLPVNVQASIGASMQIGGGMSRTSAKAASESEEHSDSKSITHQQSISKNNIASDIEELSDAFSEANTIQEQIQQSESRIESHSTSQSSSSKTGFAAREKVEDQITFEIAKKTGNDTKFVQKNLQKFLNTPIGQEVIKRMLAERTSAKPEIKPITKPEPELSKAPASIQVKTLELEDNKDRMRKAKQGYKKASKQNKVIIQKTSQSLDKTLEDQKKRGLMDMIWDKFKNLY